jgi:LuxR family transcriptional regulator, maltose regulon positive regulatory protein
MFDATTGINAIRVGSPQWYEWLSSGLGFLFEGGTGHFTARREMRRGTEYWYAYRRSNGKFSKAYLGKSQELTVERLEQASAQLAGKTLRHAGSLDWTSALNTPVTAEKSNRLMSIWARTKTRSPALPPQLLERPRLTHRITTPVTLIHAPSGYGKTTLLIEWRQSYGRPVAWAWLDASDNQPSHFWSTLVAALQTIYADFGQELLPQLSGLSPAALSTVAVHVTNEIVRVNQTPSAARPIGLILDDYHHIEHPEIHAAIQTFLEHLPPTLQLVISSRTRPPLNLEPLRQARLMTELDIDDLRMTLEEGIGFLEQQVAERPLAYSDMQALVKHAEGWIAGLKLAALALNQQTDRHQFIVTFTGAHTYVREYFTDSVLRQQPAPVQAFLLKTAILKHLTGDLCNAVTGQADGADRLAQLWQRGLFLIRLEEPGWYRYHDLFAEMLNQQLQQQFPVEVPQLHRQAAEWYRAQNAPADAVYHLLAIEAWEDAAALIESTLLRELAELGEDSRLLRWLQHLPETVVQHHKALLSVYVRLADSALPRAEVERFLARVETSIMRRPAAEQARDEREVLVEIQRLRRLQARDDSALPHSPALEEHDNAWQMLNNLQRLQRYSASNAPEAEAMAHKVYETSRAQRNLFCMMMAGGICASRAFMQGHLRRSESMAYQVLREALAQGGALPETASLSFVALSRICYARNQLAQAQQFLLRSAEVDPNPTSSNVPVINAVVCAKIQAAQGHGEAAFATLQAVRELNARRPSRLWSDQDLAAYQALFRLRQGDRAGAEQLWDEVEEDDLPALAAFVRAAILLEQRQAKTAEDLLKRLIAQYPYGFFVEPILEARLMLALALFEQHKVNQSLHVMTEAIRLAAPELFIRPFLDHGVQIASLLTLVLQNDILSSTARSFVKEILRIVGQVAGAPEAPSKDELLALSTAASISMREQEVLRLIAAGLSNREIAARLSVSHSTVKTHVANIYLKLGVNGRMQAVAQAQALKLV